MRNRNFFAGSCCILALLAISLLTPHAFASQAARTTDKPEPNGFQHASKAPLQLAEGGRKKKRVKEDDPPKKAAAAATAKDAESKAGADKKEKPAAAEPKPAPPEELQPKTVNTPSESLQIFSARLMSRINGRLGYGEQPEAAPTKKMTAAKAEPMEEKKKAVTVTRKSARSEKNAANRSSAKRAEPAATDLPKINFDKSKLKGFSKKDQ